MRFLKLFSRLTTSEKYKPRFIEVLQIAIANCNLFAFIYLFLGKYKLVVRYTQKMAYPCGFSALPLALPKLST